MVSAMAATTASVSPSRQDTRTENATPTTIAMMAPRPQPPEPHPDDDRDDAPPPPDPHPRVGGQMRHVAAALANAGPPRLTAGWLDPRDHELPRGLWRVRRG